ncbi:MAG TPA: hypothetical protein VML19_30805 [Verrucomicrobiae bacterium]|nr:hypothetical protein [Verrucomicrobiae bacterium]
MTRYLPAPHYFWSAVAVLALAGGSGWIGWHRPVVLIPAALLALSGIVLFLLAFRPVIELHEGYLSLGRRIIPWMDIRRVDHAVSWVTPLIVRLTLFDDSRVVLVYSGDLDSCNSLLRNLRRLSRDALIDGKPYRQYWGEMMAPPSERKQTPPPPRYRILRPEDEAEVERLYQRLKTVGNLDQKSSADEK